MLPASQSGGPCARIGGGLKKKVCTCEWMITPPADDDARRRACCRRLIRPTPPARSRSVPIDQAAPIQGTRFRSGDTAGGGGAAQGRMGTRRPACTPTPTQAAGVWYCYLNHRLASPTTRARLTTEHASGTAMQHLRSIETRIGQRVDRGRPVRGLIGVNGHLMGP